ncbi:MAG: Histidine kinaselike ATPase domain [Thermoleophilaceae bacterium]|jgi:anti-sigma regulatory factor (Ser/Thr protein kinase)|nr:Histidine kinaselike ATPase domain [Thermoleophilaceae bacterium]
MADHGTAHMGLRLWPVPSELARARAFAGAAGRRFGLGEQERRDFELAASEAVANAIEHGEPCFDGAIHIWTTETDNVLGFGVRNAGEFVVRSLSDDPLAERGRGLFLMSSLVHSVALSQSTDHVVVELRVLRPVAGLDG